MFDVFKRARQLDAQVLLWGRTKDDKAQIVVLKFRQGLYSVGCFDPGNGGFHRMTDKPAWEDAADAFAALLEQMGACDDPA